MKNKCKEFTNLLAVQGKILSKMKSFFETKYVEMNDSYLMDKDRLFPKR